jgi:hypothetical protein
MICLLFLCPDFDLHSGDEIATTRRYIPEDGKIQVIKHIISPLSHDIYDMLIDGVWMGNQI